MGPFPEDTLAQLCASHWRGQHIDGIPLPSIQLILEWPPNAGQDAGPWNEISFITRKNTESTATLQDSSAIAYKTERILSI